MKVPIKNPIKMGDGDGRHGTINGYCNHECRCEECRRAWTDYCLLRRVQRASALAADDPRHGKESTYFNHQCRCDECRAAHTVAARARRADS